VITTSRLKSIRGRFRGALLAFPLSLGLAACSSSATGFNCSLDCMDGTHHQATITPDGGDPRSLAAPNLALAGGLRDARGG
jgi:hypothetical protein